MRKTVLRDWYFSGDFGTVSGAQLRYTRLFVDTPSDSPLAKALRASAHEASALRLVERYPFFYGS